MVFVPSTVLPKSQAYRHHINYSRVVSITRFHHVCMIKVESHNIIEIREYAGFITCECSLYLESLAHII